MIEFDGDIDAAVDEWMALEGSSFEEPRPVELGGASGVEFAGSLAGPDVIVYGGYNPGGKVHVYALDVSGTTVVVVIDQYSESEPFLDDAQEVVQSFEFLD